MFAALALLGLAALALGALATKETPDSPNGPPGGPPLPPGGGFGGGPHGMPGPGSTPIHVPTGPTGMGSPAEPVPLPPHLQAMVNTMLTDPNATPEMLEASANILDMAGHPTSAAALRARAADLRAKGSAAPSPAPLPPAGIPTLSTYVIKAGDFASKIAQKFTGDGMRWKELLPVNPNLTVKHTKDSSGKITATHVIPFNAGQVLKLPPSWPSVPMF